MAVLVLKSRGSFLSHSKSLYLNFPYSSSSNRRKYNCIIKSLKTNSERLGLLGTRAASADCRRPKLNFESSLVTQFAVTDEIHFYRDSRNHFSQMCFSDFKEPYGPPLAILLPWKNLDENVLKRIIEFYGEKGFDVIAVYLASEQMMYPCVAGNAMNVVTDLLQYLNDTHKHRPYVFHGFSIGVYIFGELMAQVSDQYEVYRALTNNVKGCLWDSPVDLMAVKPYIGKFFYPRNFFRRSSGLVAGMKFKDNQIKLWESYTSRLRCNRAVRHHFKNHHHDSVIYWLRSRDNFCNPIIKVPNVFFVSYTDLLSNPCTLQCAQKVLECNGVPIYQKTWWGSEHGHHFEKYCYEYIYGMVLFFNLSSLFPDEFGKYRCSHATASLTNLRLRKTTRDNLHN